MNDYNEFEVSYVCIIQSILYNIYFYVERCIIDCVIDMKIGWALDMIGWACAQPGPTLATSLLMHTLQVQ